MEKYQQVLTVLKSAQSEVDSLLTGPDDEHHRLKIHTELQRSHDFLAAVSGIGELGAPVHHKLGPAKTFMGKKIEYKASTKPEDVKPDEFRVQKLKDKVEALYANFLTIDTVDLVKNYEDTVIRGVAKKVKMKNITKDNPPKVTVDFVEQIKDEIRSENERQDKAKSPAVLEMNPDNTEPEQHDPEEFGEDAE